MTSKSFLPESIIEKLSHGKNDFEVTIKEALHIKFKKPTINRQLIREGSSFVLNVF